LPLKSISILQGPSGCGKSTIIEILAGIKRPTSGTVSRIHQHAAGIPTVRDRDHIFSATLRENLAIGNSQANDHDMEQSLVGADLYSWYSALPLKLDTYIGECGNNVSGGERQRILLARALLSHNTALIIDECTSHLPEQQESQLVCEFAKSKTILFVGHRNDLRTQAQQIIFMNDGKTSLER
jgi:ABC-type transport system involved in cytochrome bd biosynthesis fused ATPase/permease subunit